MKKIASSPSLIQVSLALKRRNIHMALQTPETVPFFFFHILKAWGLEMASTGGGEAVKAVGTTPPSVELVGARFLVLKYFVLRAKRETFFFCPVVEFCVLMFYVLWLLQPSVWSLSKAVYGRRELLKLGLLQSA